MNDAHGLTLKSSRIGIHEEAPGVLSSKRFYGGILILSGLLLLEGVGIAAIFISVKDAPTALEAGKTLVIIGAGLLGVGVLEGIGKKIGGQE